VLLALLSRRDAASRMTRATSQTTLPLVDYSDDESDAISLLDMNYDDQPRKGHASASDQTVVPGMAVFANRSIEPNTTGPYALVVSDARPLCHSLWSLPPFSMSPLYVSSFKIKIVNLRYILIRRLSCPILFST
jgi:hypothetical protein